MKKTTFALYAALILSATLHARSISINYTPADKTGYLASGSNYGLVPVPGQHWTQITNKSATGIPLVDQSGNAQGTTTSLNAYDMQNYDTFTDYAPLLRSCARDFMDEGHPGIPEITVSGIPYPQYDVYIYMCNNATSSGWSKNSSVTLTTGGVKSPFYFMTGYQTETKPSDTYDSKTNNLNNTAWGDVSVKTLTLGKNTLRIPNRTGNAFVLKSYRDRTPGRASICALQIVERIEIRFTGDLTLDRADYEGTSLSLICESEGATLTLTGAANPAALTIAGAPFTLKLEAPVTASYAELQTSLAFNIETTLATLSANTNAPIITAPIVKAPTAAFTLLPLALFEAYLSVTDTAISAYARRITPMTGAKVISVNFGSSLATLAGQTGNVGVYPVDASRWLNTPSSGNTGPTPTATVIETVTDNTGATLAGTTIQACGKGTYSYGTPATLIGKLICGYIDDELNSSQNNAGFQVTAVPYPRYAVVIYYNTDGGNNALASPRVNGTYYTGDATLGFTRPVVGGGAANYWGIPSTTQLTEGQNYLLVSGLTSPNLLVNTPDWVAYQKRTCISGFQVIDMSTMEGSQTFTATHAGGDIAFSQIIWDNAAAFTPGSANIATLALQSDTTLTLDTNDLTLLKFALSCPGKLRLIVTGTAPQIGSWDLHDVKEVEINATAYTPAPVSRPPLAWLHTDTAATLATRPGETFELRAGTPIAPATYNVTYAGGLIRIDNGHYIYTAPGTATPTTLEIGPNATIRLGAEADGNLAISKMDVLITGGTVTGGRLIAAQGVGDSPSTILQTGGDITLTYTGTNSGNNQPILLGNWANSPCTYTITGGTLTAPNGYLKLGEGSRADLNIQGGRVQAIGLLGVNTVQRGINLTGGELALGQHGIPALPNSGFTLGGGHLTALASNQIATPFKLAENTTSTLSAANGQTLAFTAALTGSANLAIGDGTRAGTVALHTGEIGGNITLQAGTLALNGTLRTEPENFRYLRLTVTDWPKTNPGGIAQPGTGLVISELRLLHNGETVPWQAGRILTSAPGAKDNYWASNIADDNFTNNYYCETANPASGKYIITIDRTAAATPFNAYTLYAGVNNGRNPLAWTLEGSTDNTTWFIIDTQTLTLADITPWNDTGRTATVPGPNQGKTFTLATQNHTLSVGPSTTLSGTGTLSHNLAFAAGSTLLKTGEPAEALTALGAITLPAEGTVSAPIPQGASHTRKYYILRGPATAGLDLTPITTTDGFRVSRDDAGIFLRLRSGIILTLY